MSATGVWVLRKTSIFSAFVFAAVLLLGTYWNQLNQALQQREQASLVRDLINTQVSSVERLLNFSLLSTELLAHEVRRSDGEPADFAARAAEILRDFPSVSSLQLAPAGINRQVFPYSGNEAALGLNVFEHGPTAVATAKARDDHRLTLNGPLDLIQGGSAVIGRNPVYLPDSESGAGEYFWGFVSAVIDIERLLSVTDLQTLARSGYQYALIRPASPGVAQRVVFEGGGPLNSANVQTLDVRVPNDRWVLRMSHGPSERGLILGYGHLLSVLAALIIAWLVHYVLREPYRLRALVTSRTEELHELAYHDYLTGLVNRRLLNEQLGQALREQTYSGGVVALLYLDLDDFKRINDSMGHEVGDQLLVEVANRLRGQVRANDIVARLGGDEFAVVLRNSGGRHDLLGLAEKVVAVLGRPVRLNGRDLVISTSMGITQAPHDGDSASQLLRNADLALYASKRRGKNCVEFFNIDMQREASQLMQLEEDLRHALSSRQLALAFQPIVNIEQDRVVAFEALVRWQHPEQGLLMPGHFIPAAEQSGLIIPLGFWVLRSVCQGLVARIEAQRDLVPVALNISPQQFRDKHFMTEVAAILRETGVPPDLLEFEITESTLMDNLDATIAILNALKGLGIRISIDDFGTGYSSLALLKQLPVDTLKIDRCFVKDIGENEEDRQIIQAVIAMSAQLDLDVIAEGVETVAQRDLLHAFGCRQVQGYFYGRPVIGAIPDTGRLLPHTADAIA
ncbi:putative bifunctional diguanylate cyclase/phosphodiesterase [Marinobacterium rhizophilum]|uniref:EAL domain-containing protein n=1 Tax=Marinobacterium rhizophilum TaxID=420402 RepID=A0ABY5HJU7_9GAMM|nr:EAL domain-containing protein [Marinobacterium rhizophilum]UTW12661.1 EAL domain-containing protein [Marinobacterium rhizophilum]